MNWESSLRAQFSSSERLRKLKLLLTRQRRSLAWGVPEQGAQSSRQPMDVFWAKTPEKASLLHRKRCFAHPASSLGDPWTVWATGMCWDNLSCRTLLPLRCCPVEPPDLDTKSPGWSWVAFLSQANCSGQGIHFQLSWWGCRSWAFALCWSLNTCTRMGTRSLPLKAGGKREA